MKAIHNKPMPVLLSGKVTSCIDRRKVKVLCIVENYAMVRRPGAMPYVALLEEIEFPKGGKIRVDVEDYLADDWLAKPNKKNHA